MQRPIAIFVLGPSALPLAQLIKSSVGGVIHGPTGMSEADATFERATQAIAQAFSEGLTIIGICAAGILIRAVGPRLRDKHHEPPVLAAAEDGSMVVPLLGGHHSGNSLAREIAKAIGGTAAITTASDVVFGKSFDEPEQGYVLGNPQDMKAATAAKLRGEEIEIVETIHAESGDERRIVIHPQVLTVGIGCERGTDPKEVRDLISSTFTSHNLSRHAVANYASIDLKEDDPAIADFFNVVFFTSDELKTQSGKIKNPSLEVANAVGTPSVAEAAALAAAGPNSELLVPKTKSKRATIAIAKASQPILVHHGRYRGSIAIVGIGPGAKLFRSEEVKIELSSATDWVGYSLYLDFVKDLHGDQTLHDFSLGEEEARCRRAIALA